MKKVLNLMLLISISIIVAIAILYLTDIVDLFLWVKYLFLLNSLFVVIMLYIKFGKRTVFDECIYCLKKANKGLEKLNFNQKERHIGIDVLKIKNYLSISLRYLDEIYNAYDLYELKSQITKLKDIQNRIASIDFQQTKSDLQGYIENISSLIATLSMEDSRRKETAIAIKKQKKIDNKTKK